MIIMRGDLEKVRRRERPSQPTVMRACTERSRSSSLPLRAA